MSFRCNQHAHSLQLLDVEDAAVPVRLGDVLDFGVSYGSLVYLTNTPEVRIVYRKGGRLYTAE